MTDLWTPEDVELVARELRERGGGIWQHDARAVLAALAEAGRLLPAGVETQKRTEWMYLLTYADGEQKHRVVDDESIARAVAESPQCWNPPGQPGEVYHRTITTTTAVEVGAWLPADPAPAVSPVTEENPNG